MLIANPIYDVVFRYMMNDNEVAKMLIGAIINEEIEELTFQPTEFTGKIEDSDIGSSSNSNDSTVIFQSFSVYRLDFCAKIRSTNGESRMVLIEIQKAKLPTDIMRFRRYLGNHYTNKNTSVEVINGEVFINKKPIPIVTIYFLGHKLDHTTAPLIKVARSYEDAVTGERISTRETFIESLTHDSYIIQIPFLTKRFRNDVELLLSVFDQSNRENDEHILNVNEDEFPPKFRQIIRRLQKAHAEKEVQDTMDIEDDILESFINAERTIAKKDEVIAEKDDVIAGKDEVIAEKDEVIAKQEDLMKQQAAELERLKGLLAGSSL